VLNGCNAHINNSPHLNSKKYGKVFMPQAKKYPAEQSYVFGKDSIYYINYSATYGGPKRQNGDNISVHFSVNPALVDTFNAKNGTSYPILPKDIYEMSETEAIIPVGEISTPELKIKFKANKNLRKSKTQYLLPVTMKETKGGIKVNKDWQTTFFLIKGGYPKYDKTNWKIIGFDSAMPSNPASYAIDGDESTFFRTSISPITPLPHYIAVNMEAKNTIYGFRIVGYSGAVQWPWNENPQKITIEFSNNGTKWTNAENFTLPTNFKISSAKVYLSQPVTAIYFKIIITKNVSIGYNARVSRINEIYAF
jgi:hypothetical protein